MSCSEGEGVCNFVTDCDRRGGGGNTLVTFTPKDETIQNAKIPKKIVGLTLIEALCIQKHKIWETLKKLKFANLMTFFTKVVKLKCNESESFFNQSSDFWSV